MPQAAQFPLYLPAEALRPFATEELVRRLVQGAQLEPGSRVLALGGAGMLQLAEVADVQLVVAEPDAEEASRLQAQVAAAGLEARVEVQRVELERLPFEDGTFALVVLLGQVPMPFELALKRLRRLLVPSDGRLALTYPVRVGRQLAPEVLAFWRDRLGEPLRWPRELFMALERAGFESEDAVTLDDGQLDALYASVEEHLGGASGLAVELLKDELALHRAQVGKAGVSYALLMGRRREAGEAPFTSRDRG